MTKVHFIVSGRGVINMFMDGDRLPPINSSHPNYHEIAELLGKTKGEVDVEELMNLMDARKAFNLEADGRFRIENNNRVFIGDLELPGNLARRLMSMAGEGFTIEPFIKFCENLAENPSMRSIKQLFTFLEYRGLPITEDGHFLAYKGVTHDFKDKWTKKIDNSVGQEVAMPRNRVLDDPDQYCGPGLHAGDLEYANGWAGSDGILVLVKVNPRDAVSVPCDGQKLRCCRYTVVADHQDRNLLRDTSVYTTDGVTADVSRFTPAEYAPVNTNPASAHFEQDGEHQDEEDDVCEVCGYEDCECCWLCDCYPCECEETCHGCERIESECLCCQDCEDYPCSCDDEWD